VLDIFELFKAVSPILAAVITGYCVVLSNRSKDLNTKLLRAYKDVQFYQTVEDIHVQMNIGRGEKDNKRKVRAIVRSEFKYNNSGKAPSQVEREVYKLSR
jgi:hypothetical protein